MDIPNSVYTNTDTTDNYTQDSNTPVTEGTEHHQIKLIIDHALSNLTQDGCIYSKDLVARIRNSSNITLRIFYSELHSLIKSNGYSTNRNMTQAILVSMLSSTSTKCTPASGN